ncbi:hypothetical protein EPA99_18250 [Pseudoxanthomonas composti]|uniref:Glycine zipper domain-containing protein n=2 Tax=Pseudoxanthomonas composti TaxID=2137479 RepID=A0A4Q1JQR5_9GAMM|nr:hypothetical protein [Pseudoxanthomonas composti]RXQ98915.1 hypothetical protein EPA99_18250 [Pseudoxanthomonas composti]
MASNTPRDDAQRDLNRDPISGAPGSHPIGVGVGGAGGAAAGAAAGALLGPIGMLVGGAIGAVAGAAAGKGVAERVDPTGEEAYWRQAWADREYTKQGYDYDGDYSPAYTYGASARDAHRERVWDDSLEADLRQGWIDARGNSRLEWDDARAPVRDAWDRSDRTHRAYDASDRYYEGEFSSADYRQPGMAFEQDYRPAYRYGTYARAQYPGRTWDDALERDMETDWTRIRGDSRLEWSDAKSAVRHAWNDMERAVPGNGGRSSR